MTKRSQFLDVPDIIIITPRINDDEIMDLISSKFVGRYNNSDPILIDSFNCSTQTFLNGNYNLFPNKLLNLEGRIVKLTLMNYAPYTIWIPTVINYTTILKIFFK